MHCAFRYQFDNDRNTLRSRVRQIRFFFTLRFKVSNIFNDEMLDQLMTARNITLHINRYLFLLESKKENKSDLIVKQLTLKIMQSF